MKTKDTLLPRTPHTLVVRRWNVIAKSGLWVAAALTLTVLVMIIGYILVNGFYTRSVEQDPVTSLADESVVVGGEYPDVEFSVVASGSLRLPHLSYHDLRDMFSGENGYWGFLTGQDRTIDAAIWSAQPRFVAGVTDYLLLNESGLPQTISRIRSVEALSEFLDSSSGAVVLVPGEIGDELRGVRTVGVRQYSVAIHPSVTDLVDGRRLNSVDEAQIPAILRGELASWDEATRDGLVSTAPTGIPIRMIRLSQSIDTAERSAQAAFADEELQSGYRSAGSVEQAAQFLRETRGAFALLRSREAVQYDLPVVDVRFVRHSANLRPSFLWEAPSRAGEVGGISTIILNTLAVIVFVVLIATPIGVAAAIYMVEYAKQGRLLTALRIGTDTLAGVPSIIFGLFGLVFFSQALGLQTGLLAGAFTLTLMILPTIVRTAEEALLSVPAAYREGSLALGASKMQTIFRVTLPSAAPGIVTGMILGIGRAIGETAAVLFTMGSNLALLSSLNSPLRVLSVHLYLLVRETISIPNAFATATILVLIVLAFNTISRRLVKRLNAKVTTQ